MPLSPISAFHAATDADGMLGRRLQGKLKKPVVSLAIAAMLVGSIAMGAEPETPAKGGEHSENVLAAFVGIAREGPRDNGLALGVEYERRLGEQFGIGVLAEHTFGDIDTWVYAIPFAYHSQRWKFYLAPGTERSKHGNESLLRIGAERAFEIGSWEIAPQLDVDFVNSEQIYVVGVTLSKRF
jgi:hypothetical protein